MYKIFIKPINKCFNIDEPIITVSFNDSIVYRDFVINFNDNIIFSNDNISTNYLTNTIIIYDPLHIEINDKKILSLLYKKLSYRVNSIIQDKINKIEQDILDLLDELSLNNEFPLEYSDSLDLQKLFSMYQLSIQETQKDNYLEFIIKYIKINCELTRNNIVLSFGFTRLLTENEIEILKNELAINQICIVDFTLTSDSSKISYITIDEDWNLI